MRIVYLCYYDTLENDKENRYYVLSAKNKIDYITSVLKTLGHKVQIVSASHTQNKGLCPAHDVEIEDGIRLKLFSSFGYKSLVKKILSKIYISIQLFTWLLFKLKKKDILIVYHSMGYMNLIKALRMIKK